MTNVSGIAAEKFFNPEFKKVMESLRVKDDTIRSITSGETIGDGDPGSDPVSLKSLIKSINSNFNRREYMSAIADLGRFHKKVFDITQIIEELKLDIDAVHHEFLFKDLGDDQKKYLHEMKNRFAFLQNTKLIKEAGVMDFFYNIGTKRGRALAAWEKRYPKQVAKLKKDTANLLNKSESLQSVILSALKEMASARSSRNVDNYTKSVEKITKAYANYDKIFREFYISNVKGFLEKIELVAPTAKVPDAKELGKQEVPVTVNDPSLTLHEPVPKTDPMIGSPLIDQHVSPYSPTLLSPVNQPSLPQEVSNELAGAPDTEPSPPPNMPPPSTEEEFKSDRLAKEYWGRTAHDNFVKSLESLSQENPIILASFIAKYAKSISNSDPVVANNLLKLAKNIRG